MENNKSETTLVAKEVTKKLPELNQVREVLKTLFPPREMAPLWYLLARAKKKHIEFLAFYDEDKFVGLSFLVTHGDLTLVAYLATVANVHSKGYGSKILSFVKKKLANNRLTLTIEEINESYLDNEQRIKRKEFYAKNEFLPTTNLKIKIRGMVFEVLNNNGNTSIKDHEFIMKKYLGNLIGMLYKPKEFLNKSTDI
ncbi:MAG: GNAT family N-acetyltransferase [Firmicutes bacterium]|nr:GNAT family N-acetyltransferase [Bacillota bacterium]